MDSKMQSWQSCSSQEHHCDTYRHNENGSSPRRNHVWYAQGGLRENVPSAFVRHHKSTFNEDDCCTYQLRMDAKARENLVALRESIRILIGLLDTGSFLRAGLLELDKYYHIWTFTMSLYDFDYLLNFVVPTPWSVETEAVRIARVAIAEHLYRLRLYHQEKAWNSCQLRLSRNPEKGISYFSRNCYHRELPNFSAEQRELIRQVSAVGGISRAQFLCQYGRELLMHHLGVSSLCGYAASKMKTIGKFDSNPPSRRQQARQVMYPQSGMECDYVMLPTQKPSVICGKVTIDLMTFALTCSIIVIAYLWNSLRNARKLINKCLVGSVPVVATPTLQPKGLKPQQMQPQMGFEWMQSEEPSADQPAPEPTTKWTDSKGREIKDKNRRPMFKATFQPSGIQPYARQLKNDQNIASLNEQFPGHSRPSRK